MGAKGKGSGGSSGGSSAKAKGSASSSGPAKAASAPDTCPNCGVGVPVKVAEDENGAAYKCFRCGAGYTHPATAEAQSAELAHVHPHIGVGHLNTLARRYGFDPADYDGPEALRVALVSKGEKG